MDSRQLRYFIAVYEQRNLSRAADQASVAQSALSHHISNLESEFATPLFERRPGGRGPPAAGERLYEPARIILRAMAEAEREIKQGGGVIAGDISIGMANSGVKAIGVPLMRAVLAKSPNLKLSLTESRSGATLLHLMASEVDLALVYNPPSEKDLIAEPVLEEQMFCVGTAEVIGKSKAPITFEELTRLPLILLRYGLSSRAFLDDPVLLKRLEANAILRLNSISGTTGALLAGLGCAVATKLFAQEQLAAGNPIAREVIEPTLTRTLYLSISGTTGALLAGLGCAVATKLFAQEQLAAGSLIAREVIEPTLTRTLYLCRLRNRPMTYAMEEMRRLMLSLIAEQVGRGAWEATLLI